MKTTIYYFSASGNSLAYAKKIAAGIGSTELISIPKIFKENEITSSSENVGIIIPVYAWGPPRMVQEFAKKLKLNDDQYIFAIATCAGVPGNTLARLNKILNKDIDAGFVVIDENHTPLDAEMFLISLVTKLAGKNPKYEKDRSEEVIETIKKKKKHKLESSSMIGNIFGKMMHGPAVSSFKKADKAFLVNDKCNYCETCVKVCPRNNIAINNKKHIWKHNCESCFACLNWCPKEAIQYGKDKNERSHNPDIKLNEIILR